MVHSFFLDKKIDYVVNDMQMAVNMEMAAQWSSG